MALKAPFSVACKILERILKANILQYLKKASFFSDAQHGFVPRRSCLTNLIIAEELIIGMTDQSEPVDVVNLNFSKAFNSVCHRLLIKKMEAMAIHPKINRWVEEILNNRTFRVKLGDHHSSEGAVKSGVLQGSVLGPLLSQIFINDLADELTCNHLDDVKLIAPRSQQRELRSSIRQTFNWSHRWDIPLNACKNHHLSGGTPDLRIGLSEEAAGKSLQKCEQINDLGITLNAAFTPSANVLLPPTKLGECYTS